MEVIQYSETTFRTLNGTEQGKCHNKNSTWSNGVMIIFIYYYIFRRTYTEVLPIIFGTDIDIYTGKS